MRNLNNVTKVIIVSITAAILIILFIVYGGTGGPNQNQDVPIAAAPVPTSTPENPTETSTPAQPVPSPSIPANPPIAQSPPPPTISISIITPAADDAWNIGTQNLISWNKPGTISGSISLIDAATQQFVGVILPQVGPNQTSYTWDTRDVLINRSSPYAKDILPGRYEIQLSYDGNNIQPVMSPVFTITN